MPIHGRSRQSCKTPAGRRSSCVAPSVSRLAARPQRRQWAVGRGQLIAICLPACLGLRDVLYKVVGPSLPHDCPCALVAPRALPDNGDALACRCRRSAVQTQSTKSLVGRLASAAPRRRALGVDDAQFQVAQPVNQMGGKRRLDTAATTTRQRPWRHLLPRRCCR